ncbi:T9SS-dependent choice-of-anchor J family protein [Chryseobacterium luquanense]|uniref:Choice-of-anchor J domain-containing protein n=1 Tax=Chryseobacterium luquanense TaxID=2983766 RepID=A0ABT3Y2B6_9FLAO|nr:choice-of-anchor J domain-containing protein [Chryseobacterium luquanense]MCX8532282.1 choice-of-anchor J domain-containing protein [Chryseobacterium luquanense]
MKRQLLNVLLLGIPVFGFSQIFQENFDGSGQGISAWTVIDVDGLIPATSVNFITNGWNRIDRAGTTGSFGGPAGNFAAMSTSWYNPAGTSNDWLISPTIPVSGASPTLYWDAKAQDATYRDGYKVMLSPNGGNTVADFTVQLYSTTAENSSWTSRAADLTPYIGQNVRFAFVNNSNDKFLLLVDNIKVDYTYVAPPPSYCGPLFFGDATWGDDGDEPITLVNFAGINNTSDDEEYLGNSHEYFLNQIGTVTQGQSYNITLKGNTAGNYTNYFTVFIDWNQNGILDDSGEVYEVTQTITGSTGLDATQAVHSIAVPSNALPGNTRMRVKKVFDEDDVLDPCAGSLYGQAEDYTINVLDAQLAVNEAAKKNSGLKAYPNPVSDILNINSDSKIKSVKIYDLSGKNVLETEKSSINVSGLTSGTYIVTAQTENGIQSSKIIKK